MNMIGYSSVQEPVTVSLPQLKRVQLLWCAIIGIHIFQAAVWYALNNYCYTDAIFIAERLHAEGQLVAISVFTVTRE